MPVGFQERAINGFGSKVVLDTFNNRVFNHEVFLLSKRITLAGNTTTKFVFDPTENGAFPKDTLVILPFLITAFNGGPVNVDIYAGVQSTATGTVLTAQDLNFMDPVTPHVVIRQDPTITNDGVKSPIENVAYSAASHGQQAGTQGETGTSLLSKLDPTVRYAVHAINTSADTAELLVRLRWFEVPNA